MPLAEQGCGFEKTLHTLLPNITDALNLSSLNPRYYGFVTGGVTPAALAADFLTSIYDQNVSVHLSEESIATKIEYEALNLVLDMLRLERNVFPSKIFTTGATASNILGLALGREWLVQTYGKLHGVSPLPSVGDLGLLEACSQAKISKIEIVSTMPHSSIAKAASVVGLGRSSIVDLFDPHDPITLNMDALETYIGTRAPTTATILVLSIGEVNTGFFATSSLEQMQQLRTLCTTNNIWIHADGAFGLFNRLLLPSSSSSSSSSSKVLPDSSAKLPLYDFTVPASGTLGLELVDSITGDAHKFLNVPYDCGIFFSRHPPSLLESVFQNGNAAYLRASPHNTSTTSPPIPSPLNIGLENSRRFRALPVYATLLSHGRKGYLEILQRQILLCRKIITYLLSHDSYIVLPSSTIISNISTIALFRARDPDINKHLVARIKATGKIYVSGTMWDGVEAARLAVCNWRVDVERDFEIVRGVLDEILS
ncbi:putative tyrosine [Phaeomoniella chlamydospora]|uniref:Putative tyrosine n=1 Tax=Phaeomoniella chlamydospora TaxID=158046 RepID=A0A0G2GKT6_PHACM|nr:putative tyrosine [Phaeomoniella chlamydospora]